MSDVNHEATNNNCPSFILQKRAKAITAFTNKPFKEALRFVRNNEKQAIEIINRENELPLPKLSDFIRPTISYADITKRNPKNKKNPLSPPHALLPISPTPSSRNTFPLTKNKCQYLPKKPAITNISKCFQNYCFTNSTESAASLNAKKAFIKDTGQLSTNATYIHVSGAGSETGSDSSSGSGSGSGTESGLNFSTGASSSSSLVETRLPIISINPQESSADMRTLSQNNINANNNYNSPFTHKQATCEGPLNDSMSYKTDLIGKVFSHFKNNSNIITNNTNTDLETLISLITEFIINHMIL